MYINLTEVHDIETDVVTSHTSENAAAMSIAKGIGFLVLFYLLIAGSVVWRVRELCLLQHDGCDYYDLLDTVFSSRLITIACAVFVGLLIFVTAHVVARLRDNTLGIDLDPPERQYNVNGYMVALVVFPLYLGGALVLLTSAASDLGQFHEDKVISFFWRAFWVMQGSLILLMIVWHLNDYFVKPASRILLFLIFIVTLGSIGWIVNSALVPA